VTGSCPSCAPPASGSCSSSSSWPSTRPTGESLLALLERLNAAGTTIVVITHDRAVAARMHRQIAMLDGRIVGDTGAAQEESPERLAGIPGAPRGGMS